MQTIEEYLESPLQIGDYVEVLGLGQSDKSKWGRSCRVIKIDIRNNSDGHIWLNDCGDKRKVIKGEYRKSSQYYGVNPFQEKSWQSRIKSSPIDLASLLYAIGWDKTNKKFETEKLGTVEIPTVNWEPTININNKQFPYQRDFVWELSDKQHLINSIYKGIEIGKFVIRARSWDWVENNVKQGNVDIAFKDIIDGKQRLSTLIEFVSSEFPDSNGNYFKELSLASQRKFMNFMGLTYITIGSMDRDCEDIDVLDMFLNVNIAGVKVDEQHIKYVEGLKQKLEETL